MTSISARPPKEWYAISGIEIDCQCARCGGYMASERCGSCEDGFVDRYEEDPLWYGHELYKCSECDGAGHNQWCGNGADWCEANPMPGRENVRQGEVEWFTVGVPS